MAELAADLSSVSTVTAALTNPTLYVDPLYSRSTITASLTTGIPLAAALTSVSTMTAAVSVHIRLAAALTSVSTTTADMTTGINLASALTSVSTVTADLTAGPILFDAALSSVSTITAALTTQPRLVSAMTSASTITADLTTGIPLNASMASVSTTTAALTTSIELAAALTSVSTVTAALRIGYHLDAALTSVSTVTAALTTGFRLQSSLSSVSTITADLSVAIPLAANLSSVSTVTAMLSGSGYAPVTPSQISYAMVESIQPFWELDGLYYSSTPPSVVVVPAPVISILETFYYGLEASVTIGSTGGDVRYSDLTIDWGDGNVEALVRPPSVPDAVPANYTVSHTYDTYGAYTVTVTGTNATGSDTDTTMFESSAVPSVNITSLTADELVVTLTLAFSGGELPGMGDVTIDWGDGSVVDEGFYNSSDNPYHHSYDEVGTYTVSVYVTNEADSSNTAHEDVTVTAPPTVTINSLTASGDYATLALSYGGGPLPGSNDVFVDWGDGTLETLNSGFASVWHHTYPSPDTYTVSVYTTNAVGNSNTAHEDVTVSPVPPTGHTLWIDADAPYLFANTGGTTPITDGTAVSSFVNRSTSALVPLTAAGSNRPTFSATALNLKPSLNFAQVSSQLLDGLETFPFNLRSVTVGIAFMPIYPDDLGGGGLSSLFGLGYGSDLNITAAGNTSGISAYNSAIGFGPIGQPRFYFPAPMVFRGSGAAFKAKQFLYEASLGALSATSGTGVTLGVVGGVSFYGNIRIAALMIYPTALNDADTLTLSQYLAYRVGVPQPNAAIPICSFDGNSIVYGSGCTNIAYSVGTKSFEGLPVNWVSAAIPGQTAAEILSRYAARSAPFLSGSQTKKIAGFYEFVNSYLAGVTSASDQFQICVDWATAARSAGATKVYVPTPLPTTNAGYNTMRAALRTMLLADAGANFDAVPDIGGDPTIGPDAAASNPLLYPDTIHPSDLASGIAAAIIKTSVQGLL